MPDHAVAVGTLGAGSVEPAGRFAARAQRLPLLERDAELRVLRGALDAARAGAGGVLAVEGPPGIGKTRLAMTLTDEGRAAGMNVLTARGRELESDFSFGVVRQFFERLLNDADGSARERILAGPAGLIARSIAPGSSSSEAAGAPESRFQALHGLYWLLANVAEGGPVLLVLDDAHWADPASLSFLAFAAPRLAELRVLMLVTSRLGGFTRVRALAELANEPAAEMIRLAPLSAGGVGEMVLRHLGTSPTPKFTDACLKVTGGNPFLLLALLSELRREGIEPGVTAADRVLSLTSKAVGQAVLSDLARLSPAAVPLARAVAILEDARPADAAALAGLEGAQAVGAADELVRASILRAGARLEFRHAIVRNVVYEDIPPAGRSELHRRAAEVLANHPRGPEAAAAHLLLTHPAHDREAGAILLEAAERAMGRGSPESATAYLARALDETLDPQARSLLLASLGRARALVGDPEAATTLDQALAITEDSQERAQVVRDFSLLATLAGDVPRGLSELEAAIERLGDPESELSVLLECDFVCFSQIGPGMPPQAVAHARRLRGLADRAWREGTPAGRMLAVRAALDAAVIGEPAETVGRLIDTGLAEGRFVAEQRMEASHFPAAAFVLIFTDRLKEANEIISAGIEDCQKRGSIVGFVQGSTYRSMGALRAGALAEAEADARAALEARAVELNTPLALACLLHVLIERGELAEANRLLESHGTVGPLGDPFFFVHLAEARGRLKLAEGRPERALEDLLDAGRRMEGAQIQNPAILAWRSSAALAHLAAGNRAEAKGLATEEAELATAFGAPRAIGIALRTLGLAEGGPAGLDLLEQSVSVLERSPAKLDWARSLVELGAALRRVKRRVDARERLRPALQTAVAIGATALATQAREELLATGARPRRVVLSGVDSLTASERRVARMAATGLSNPEIAQRLFVTRKTIEVHLSHCYQKLDITSRTALPQALGAAAKD